MGYEIEVTETNPPSFAPSWWNDEDFTEVRFDGPAFNATMSAKGDVSFSSVGVSYVSEDLYGFAPWSSITRLSKN